MEVSKTLKKKVEDIRCAPLTVYSCFNVLKLHKSAESEMIWLLQ